MVMEENHDHISKSKMNISEQWPGDIIARLSLHAPLAMHIPRNGENVETCDFYKIYYFFINGTNAVLFALVMTGNVKYRRQKYLIRSWFLDRKFAGDQGIAV